MPTKIESFLDSASKAYYTGTPFLSDEQFDRLANTIGYNKVGSTTDGKTGKHFFPMYSLQKFYEDEGAKNPLEGIKDITYSLKLDGAAISVLYIDGKLVKVLTRGDGVEGTDITDRFFSSNILPLSIIAHGLPILQITGEIVAHKDVPNSRNYAAGSLNLKDINEFKTRAISFIAYGCYPSIDLTYDYEMKLLSRWGFSTVKDNDLHLIYPSDGLVYRINNNKLAYSMGYTASHPKFAYALKERQDCVETVIEDVIWQTGRTGRVTPIALLKPVMIGDKEVSRATLNNPGFIEALDIRIGDKVAVRLAGLIIPEVVHKVDA